jgi:hypothetical protein
MLAPGRTRLLRLRIADTDTEYELSDDTVDRLTIKP